MEHQLKLYQDSLEEKATETKKEHTGLEKDVEGYKKRIEELREIKSINGEQILKLQQDNEDLKNEIKSLKMKKIVKRDEMVTKREEMCVEKVERGGNSVEKREITKRL